MTSAQVIWNYQRKLSFGSMSSEEQKELEERRRKRTLSNCSSTHMSGGGSDRENRLRDSGSEEDLDNPHKAMEEKSKKGRRFSLDFLFSRKAKMGKKDKSQRAMSLSESSNDDFPHKKRTSRKPSMEAAEFALAM